MSKFSPIACAIVVEHFKRVQSMSLEEAFVTEYGVSRAIFDSGEFYEGVRALLVDKNNKPKWKHSSIEEVTVEDIEAYYSRPEKLNLDLMGDFKDAITYK